MTTGNCLCGVPDCEKCFPFLSNPVDCDRCRKTLPIKEAQTAWYMDDNHHVFCPDCAQNEYEELVEGDCLYEELGAWIKENVASAS